MRRRHWPVALALVSSVVLGSYLLYTEHLVREIRAEAELHSRMYALVQQGVLSLDSEAERHALMALQSTLVRLGVPMVAVNEAGEPYAVENLPFAADLSDPQDRERVLAYAARLDRQNEPIVERGAGTIHFGAPPVLGWLRWVPWLQVGTAVLLLMVAVGLIRADVRAERERLWAAMARELAHQMGTPLSSLAGWVEMLRVPEGGRPRLATPETIAGGLADDVERLERVSRRFETIGRAPELTAHAPAEILDELNAYLRPRIPQLAAGVTFRVRAGRNLPPVRANRALIVWALENLVKNALDALAGRRGRIRVIARAHERGGVAIYVTDTGPGIPAGVAGRIFEPGVTTKPGGWGVGLSLGRRIVEELHGGRIGVRARRGGGTVFEVQLPSAQGHSPRSGRAGRG